MKYFIPALHFPVHPCTHRSPAISSSPLHSSQPCNFQFTPALIPALQFPVHPCPGSPLILAWTVTVTHTHTHIYLFIYSAKVTGAQIVQGQPVQPNTILDSDIQIYYTILLQTTNHKTHVTKNMHCLYICTCTCIYKFHVAKFVKETGYYQNS